MSFPALAVAILPAQESAEPSMADYLPMFAVMFFIFWFLVIRPEKRERKKRDEMMSSLKKNDRVLTTGGMYATVAAVGEKELTLKFDDGPTRVRVVRAAIASVLSDDDDDDAK